VELIETLAERIAAMLLLEFATSRVLVQVDKPGAVPAAQTVGVRIVRSRH
jgi:dihydroneopterin aldolase